MTAAAAEALRGPLAETFSGELVDEVIALFTRADVDGSGTISAGELRPLLSELYLWTSTPVFEDMIGEEADGLMREFDKDMSSALDAEEFIAMLKTSRLNKVLKDRWKAQAAEEQLEFSTVQGLLAELRRGNPEPIYLFDAIGVLKHADLWARGGTDSFVELKAVMVDDREKPASSRLALGLLYAAQDFYSLHDFLKVHNFMEGPVLVRHDAKLYASASLASTMQYLNSTCSWPYQRTSLDSVCLKKHPEDWHFGYRLRLRCAFSVEEYEKGKVGSGPTLGLEENLKLLADWIWLIHHFTAEEEDSAATVELYTSKQFLAKDINGEKVPLTETRKVIEELWMRNAEEINMDHITKKLKTQALELYSRIEM